MSDNIPLVTIGIPTYNRADGYFKDALESAIQQTYTNLEIVVSDNASTDHTDQLVKSYNDSRIKYYKHPENIGANNNFNYCLEKATGQYFNLLHDDDLLDRDFIEICMDSVLKHDKNIGMVRTGVKVVNESTNSIKHLPNRFGGLNALEIFKIYCDSAYLTFCNVLFDTKKLKSTGGFHTPSNLSVDAASNLFMTALHGSIEIEDVKAMYREHNETISSAAQMIHWVTDHYYLIEKMCEFYPEHESELKKHAYKFMSMKDYLKAKSTASVKERYRSYWRIYRIYNFHISPVSWFLRREVLSRLNYDYLRQKFKTLFLEN